VAGSNSPFTTVWFYNSVSGAVISEPAIGDTIQAHLPGWHGPFSSKQAALDYYASNSAANPGWKAPTGFAGNVGNTVGAAASAAGGSVLDVLKGLTARELWVRIAEGALGIALILVAVAELGKGTAIGKAAKMVPFI